MSPREVDEVARAYYAERYEVLCDYGFVTKPPIRLNDHNPKDQTARKCRFCGRGKDQAKFSKIAHAVSELLGNKTIRSMNECDDCNEHFATEFEVHLGNWSQFPRSVAQVKGKGGAPAYANPSNSMRLSNDGGKLAIFLTDKSLFEKANSPLK
jgi:HNH endonuclease